MSWLLEFDKALFERINGSWTHPWLDAIMPTLTDLHRAGPWPFVALALTLGIWIVRKKTEAAKTIVLIALSVALSDMISYRLVKPLIDRPRPEYSGVQIQLRTESHSGRSFPSNHAANNFAAARTLSYIAPGWGWLWFFIAFTIAYSRIYVGVHFPLDVFGGAMIGLTMATLVWRLAGIRRKAQK